MDQSPDLPQNQVLQRSETQAIPKDTTGRIVYQTYFCLLGTTLLVLSIISYGIIKIGEMRLYYFYCDAFDNYKLIIENWQYGQLLFNRNKFNQLQMAWNCGWMRLSVWFKIIDIFKICLLYWLFKLIIITHGSQEIRSTIIMLVTQHKEHGDVFPYMLKTLLIFIDSHQKHKKKGSNYVLCLRKTTVSILAILIQMNVQKVKQNVETSPITFIVLTENTVLFYTSQPQCPVFEIGFKGASEVQDAQEQTEKGFTLLYNRKSEYKLPLVEVRVSEGKGICMKNHERGLTSGRTEYSLMRENKTECEIDNRFIKLQSSNEVEFYESNNQLKLQDQLRGYEISTQYQWGLYGRGYIEWKMSCRGETFDNFIDQEQILEEILHTQKLLMIVSIIYFFVISVMWSCIQAQTIQGEDWPCIKGRGTEESNTIFYLEILTKVLLQSLQAFIIFSSFSKTKAESDFLEGVLLQNCSDEYVQLQLEYLRDMLTENIYNFNKGCLILFCVTTAFDFCVALYLVVSFIKDRNSKQSSFEYRDEIKQGYELNQMNGMTNQNQQQLNDQSQYNN